MKTITIHLRWVETRWNQSQSYPWEKEGLLRHFQVSVWYPLYPLWSSWHITKPNPGLLQIKRPSWNTPDIPSLTRHLPAYPLFFLSIPGFLDYRTFIALSSCNFFSRNFMIEYWTY